MYKHIHSLDYLRGIAAVLVCLFHFTNKLDYLPDSDVLKSICSYGHYGVEIFFILSGFIIPYGMANGGYTLDKFFVFLKKRIIRIEPPYLVCVLLALFLNYLTSINPTYSGPAFKIDFTQLFLHFGYLNPYFEKDWLNPVFWTLAIEFQYYLIIAVIFPIINSSGRVWYLLLLFLFNFSSFYFGRGFIFYFSIYFTVGILVFRYFQNKLCLFERVMWLLLVTLYLIERHSYTEVWVVYLTSIAIIIPLPRNTVARFFGNISYSLYLLHFIVGLRIINLTQRFSGSIETRYMMIPVALLIAIIISYIYYWLIERPFKNRSQKIAYTKREKFDSVISE